MPYNFLNLQLFAEEGGGEMAGAVDSSTGIASGDVTENPAGDGVATGTEGEQAVPAEETWDTLIKGKYKKDYDKAVQAAISKRFKNQQNLQAQINNIDPIIRAVADKYGIKAGADGGIPIDQLRAKVLDDDSLYEEEAFQRGMSVADLKQLKNLERENAQLRAQTQQTEKDREWSELSRQAEALRAVYPDFNMEAEMENPQFGRLLVTMQRSGFPNAVQTAYEAVHRDEIMGGAMRYAIQRTNQKISNSIQSGMRRPAENGTSGRATAQTGGLDPSHLTLDQIRDLKSRAERGERITF